MLALAIGLARAHGIEEPVAITHRFPGSAESDESQWQEVMAAHLGLREWVKLSWSDELDLVGPYAGPVLRRHGQVMPFNAHFLVPLLAQARGGSLLTGIGGDELFGPVDRRHLARLLFERRMPSPRAFPTLLTEAAPRAVRVRRAAARHPFLGFSWLRPDVRPRLARAYARTYAMPLRWDASIDHMWRSRYLQCGRATLTALAQDHDVVVAAPFFDPEVLAGFARAAGAAGLGPRADSLPDLVGDAVPERLARRTTKASFDGVFFNSHSRAFAEAWDGTGVDDSLVDAGALAAEWRSERPNANTFSLLQQAWLASLPAQGRHQTVEPGVEAVEAAGPGEGVKRRTRER